MPSFLVHHPKTRARSVQFDKSIMIDTTEMAQKRESAGTPPVPSVRHSSLALGQENRDQSIRHYRSMLVVDAPILGPLKPLDYTELYPEDSTTPGTFNFWRLLQFAPRSPHYELYNPHCLMRT
jgi:hypothetical protein